MYRKILLAYDGSNEGRAALAEAANLATLCKAEIVVLSVVDAALESALAEGATVGGAVEEEVDQVRQILAQAAGQLTLRGINTATSLAAGNPGERIATLAREMGVDLIVLGHRQHGLWERWMQEPAGAFLFHNPPCSLLVCVAKGE